MKVQIKPLSVNCAWQGRRFKTKNYLCYEKNLMLLLPKVKIDKEKKLSLSIIFGLSNKASDIDNGIKPLLDILQKKWDFDDKMIYELNVYKNIVSKGGEYIDITLNYY